MTELTALNRLILAVTLSIPLICFATALVIWGAYWLMRFHWRQWMKRNEEQALYERKLLEREIKRRINRLVGQRIQTEKASDLPTDDQWFDALQSGRFHAKEPRNASH